MTHFTMWPQGATAKLRAAGLKDGPPMQVLIEMLTWWNRTDDNRLFMSIDKLCAATGYPARTVQRAVADIRASKLLTHLGGGTRNNPTIWGVSKLLKEIIGV